MKSLIKKIFINTPCFDFFILIVPFILWIFCFRYFFNGQLSLQADAISYADHISFYADNLSKGIFPLWDPGWFNGAPNHFFLRRFGDVNPLLALLVVLKWMGVPSGTAYLLFLGLYFFLAGWVFYLIARFLLVDRFFAYIAYILFLFSSWGSEVFYNYIIIIFVPIIWFFYFLLRFSRSSQKGFFLGMCLCVGIIVTTYIPFFFLTILVIFTFFYVLLYGKIFVGFLRNSLSFFNKNKVFALFCVIFLVSSCIPALIFYKESKNGEFALPGRHLGSDTPSAVAVGLENVASGDIINHGYFDRVFNDHTNLDMGDIYIPYIFFLALVCTAFGRVNKLIFFLLFNMLALSLITITSASGVHHFLFEHIIFFKFIRNIYYFFWLSILPMGILLSVTAFKSLLTTINGSAKKTTWLLYLMVCHLAFALFLYKQQGVLVGAWAAVFISMLYFWIYLRYESRISYPTGFYLLLLAVFIQSAQVYACLDNKLIQTQKALNHIEDGQVDPKKMKLDLYYASKWFTILVNYIDPQVLDDYRKNRFIFYDNVLPYKDSPGFFKILQNNMAANNNIAFVSGFESGPNDWRNDPNAGPNADVDPLHSGKLSLLPSDANTWRVKAHLASSEFLVVNDNYNIDWHAFINGHQARLLRANVAFKGLWVPPGDSQIVLRFSDPKRYMLHFIFIAFFTGAFVYLLVLLRAAKERGTYE